MFIKSDRDKEILEYGLIIGTIISGHQSRDAGSTSFTDGWSCDYEMAEWAEKIIDEWVKGCDAAGSSINPGCVGRNIGADIGFSSS